MGDYMFISLFTEILEDVRQYSVCTIYEILDLFFAGTLWAIFVRCVKIIQLESF
jgi:hypothetical protein